MTDFKITGSIISVVGKTTVEIIELFKCTQKGLLVNCSG